MEGNFGLFEIRPHCHQAVAGFMSQAVERSVSFSHSQMVLTGGATPALEILIFCLADPGNAFLVPSPYHPDLDRDVKWRGLEWRLYLFLAAVQRTLT
ncbi:hypothetical protein HAX54_020757 [Datura stramonium]|uniref:Aminotransferase class I/classII large domain-containing protein n=1 Tax=Datura stramonium TaxID=4076 RepID=A0ABS8RMW3_DATST|nr:hypothetical protein [Datura stramonium]